MRGITIQVAASLFGAGALAMGGMVPVAAASSSGAEVYNVDECFEATRGTLCLDETVESNWAETPSGNVIYQINGKCSYTFLPSESEEEPDGDEDGVEAAAGPGLPGISGDCSYHQVYVARKDEPAMQIVQKSNIYVTEDGENCTRFTKLHLQGEKLILDEFSLECA